MSVCNGDDTHASGKYRSYTMKQNMTAEEERKVLKKSLMMMMKQKKRRVMKRA